jgi:uncharacterized membrane protein YqiK
MSSRHCTVVSVVVASVVVVVVVVGIVVVVFCGSKVNVGCVTGRVVGTRACRLVSENM